MGRRLGQLFEMMGDHAIYPEGWLLSTKVVRPPWEAFGAANPDPVHNVTWELYDLTKDFSQCEDIAAKHPEKVKELQKLFLAEAKKCRTQLRKFADGRFGTHGELREWDRGRVRREWSGSVGHGGGDAVRGAAGRSETLPYFWANGSTRMWLAAAWLRAIRVPLTWHRIVVVPETFVTQDDSPNPISRTRWQK